MQVRHNTALLEKAIDLVVERAAIPTRKAQAEAAEREARAAARRRLATGAAVAVAAVGIGLGLFLGFWQPPILPRLASLPAPQPEAAEPARPGQATDPAPGKITVNFTKFAKVTVPLLRKDWTVTAGHAYAINTDERWREAWCYTDIDVDGVAVKVDLAQRASPSARPLALVATPETLARVGLDDAGALALAAKCPWLDDARPFRVDELETAKGRHSAFAPSRPSGVLKGRTFVYEGPIADGFLASLQARDFDRLQVSSPGGLLTEAMKAGEWLRRSGKSVEAGSDCLSACVMVLAGGTVRTAAPRARIGVHRFRAFRDTADRNDMEVSQVVSSAILRYLDAMGIDQALFHAMAAVPSDDMAYIDHATLRGWNLLGPNPSTPRPAPAVTPGQPAEPAATPGALEAALTPQPPVSRLETGRTPEAPGTRSATPPALPPPIEIATPPGGSLGTADFQGRDSFDAMGHDLPGMPLPAADAADCEARCRSTGACNAYTFNRRANACFLKDEASVLIADTAAVSGYRTARTPDPRLSRLRIQSRKAFSGPAVAQFGDKSYVDCVMACEANLQCRAFTHVSASRQCTLFGTVTGETDAPGVASGFKG